MTFFRSHFSNIPVTQKQHLFEVFCVPFLRRNRFGLVPHREQGGEETHATISEKENVGPGKRRIISFFLSWKNTWQWCLQHSVALFSPCCLKEDGRKCRQLMPSAYTAYLFHSLSLTVSDLSIDKHMLLKSHAPSLTRCCSASFPYVSSEVVIIFFFFFFKKQLWHWECDSAKYTRGVSPILFEQVLITMYGLFLISFTFGAVFDLFTSFELCLSQLPGKSDQISLL